MTFFPDPIKPSEGRQEDRFRVDPIEADKYSKEGEAGLPLPEEKKRSALYGSFLIMMNKFTQLFTETGKQNFKTTSENEIVANTQKLREIIDRLKNSDESSNAKFCQKFSEVWHTLREELQLHDRTKYEIYIDTGKLKNLINEMNLYPPSEEHRLGFYLSEYAGETWLPIPFRDILKKLHVSHRKSPQDSILNKWLDLITEILRG